VLTEIVELIPLSLFDNVTAVDVTTRFFYLNLLCMAKSADPNVTASPVKSVRMESACSIQRLLDLYTVLYLYNLSINT
jgi:hypothetical protein